MVPERFFFDKSQLERSITAFMFNNSLLVYFQKMLPSSKKLEKYGMGEPPTHQESLLLSHAREVHHAYSHIRSHLAGGAHALYLIGPGTAALAHATIEAFLRTRGALIPWYNEASDNSHFRTLKNLIYIFPLEQELRVSALINTTQFFRMSFGPPG